MAHFQLNEINTALKLYEMKPLYAKDKRDACIIVAVNHRKYDLGDIDEMLENQGLMKLSKTDLLHPHHYGGDFFLFRSVQL